MRTGDEYLVCIMPLCDAERVPAAGQVFPFLRAVEGRDNEHRNVVVTDEGGSGSLLELYIPVAMPHLVLAEFRPEADKQPVRAKGGDGSPFLFESSNQSAVYRYVARLRPMVAQEIAAGLAAAGARVGLMHSEYARR